jgi:predicted nucleic-acid-binding protein
MRLTADTNVLVRALTEDDPQQAGVAQAQLAAAEAVAITLPTLCELVWVLSRGYRISTLEIALAIKRLINSDSVLADRPAVDAGLAEFEAGGDFADGVIAFEGRRLGADEFVSFDVAAVRRMIARGEPARLLS